MRKLSQMLVDFVITDSDSKTSDDIADALVNEEGFSVARAALESRAFFETCKARDTEALRGILESGFLTLRLHAAWELAQLGDTASISLLLRNLEKTRADKNAKAQRIFRNAISHLINQMASVPQPEHLPYYLDFLRWQRRYRLPIDPIVNAITVIAETWPSPELQEALPLLKNHPKARLAIERCLLPGARFPIPAERPATTENLPRPASENNPVESAEFLPLPSEASNFQKPESLVKRLKKRILPWP